MSNQKTIKQLKDGSTFRLSKRSEVVYKVIRKWKYPKPYQGAHVATITSLSSERSFIRSLDTVCYV